MTKVDTENTLLLHQAVRVVLLEKRSGRPGYIAGLNHPRVVPAVVCALIYLLADPKDCVPNTGIVQSDHIGWH